MTPLQRSLRLLRSTRWLAEKVEQRLPIPRRFVTRDLFGFLDIVALRGRMTLGVQVTTASNLAARVAKAKRLPAFRAWLRAGNRVEFHGWAKRGPRAARKRWMVRVLDRFAEETRATQ